MSHPLSSAVGRTRGRWRHLEQEPLAALGVSENPARDEVSSLAIGDEAHVVRVTFEEPLIDLHGMRLRKGCRRDLLRYGLDGRNDRRRMRKVGIPVDELDSEPPAQWNREHALATANAIEAHLGFQFAP